MTKEKAIKELSEWLAACCGGEEIDPTREALRMAIEALKAKDYASERYADLCAFFSGHHNKGADILHSREEFEKWLERMRWHVEECDRLSKELDALKAQNVPNTNVGNYGDTIYRQAAIDAFGLSEKTRKYGGDHSGYDTRMLYEIQDVLEGLPPAQPERKKGKWIPCSEMEPKKSGHYLCTHGGTGIVSPDYYTTQEQAEELFADPEDEYLDLEEYIGWTSKNVIAWMPLPEPYKEKTDD